MYKFAILGCGRIAQRHAEILSGTLTNAKLVAVCDNKENKAQAFSEKYGVPFFTNIAEMMNKSAPDIVSVLTPSGMHCAHVLEISEYGKHIIVEKPMALTLDDADRMISACDKHGCRLFVVKQNRFNVPVVKLRQAIENDRFGKLILGTVRVRWCRTQEYYDQDPWRGTWELDGGVLANQASHHLDLLEWMMGEVDSVFAKGKTALVDIEVEDTAIVLLKFRNGALGCIEATTATRPADLEGSISILGERGSVEISGFAVNQMKTWQFTERQPADSDVMEKFSENPPNVYGFGHQAYYEHVIDCLSSERQQLVDGIEGRRSLELINAIYESIETQKEVQLKFASKHCRLGTRNDRR